MKKTLLGMCAAMLLTAAVPMAAQAEPGGCLKYGAVGAVGGHVAGHHGVLGAMGGCATGMWVRHKHRQELRNQAAQGVMTRQQNNMQGMRDGTY